MNYHLLVHPHLYIHNKLSSTLCKLKLIWIPPGSLADISTTPCVEDGLNLSFLNGADEDVQTKFINILFKINAYHELL